MGDNLVIPQTNPSTNLPAGQYSLGPKATDFKTPANTTSAVSAIKVLDSLIASVGLPPLNSSVSRNSLANVISGYYKPLAAGPALGTSGNSSDIRMSSLINAQTLYVTISAFKERATTYRNAKNAKIVIGFPKPETWQRSVADWRPISLPDVSSRQGSYTITIIGNASTVINGNPYTIGASVEALSNLKNGSYQVTVKDNYSGFYMTTTVVCPYGGSLEANVYDRVPWYQRLNNGTWQSNSVQGYN